MGIADENVLTGHGGFYPEMDNAGSKFGMYCPSSQSVLRLVLAGFLFLTCPLKIPNRLTTELYLLDPVYELDEI